MNVSAIGGSWSATRTRLGESNRNYALASRYDSRVLPGVQQPETPRASPTELPLIPAVPPWLKPLATKLTPGLLALVCCAFALLMGLAFLPIPGLHYDEILFLHPYLHQWSLFRARIAGVDIPLMVMSYVGAVKTWLFWPVYHWLPPSVWAVRLPALLLGCVNFWLMYRLGALLIAPAAGVVAIAIAATDPTLLLTQVFDWGPVTLQIFLSLSAMLLFVTWQKNASPSHLVLCGLCCGLSLWNKATFVWLMIAIGAATLICWPACFHPAHLWNAARLYWRAWLLAALSFVLGAAPFLGYNVREQGATVTANARIENHFPTEKLVVLVASLNGRSVASNVGVSAATPSACTDGELHGSVMTTPLPPFLQAMPSATWTPWLLAAAVAVFVWHWRRSAARIGFCLLLVFAIHSALAMTAVGGGTGLHHYAPVLPAVFLCIGAAWNLLWSWLRERTRRFSSWLSAGLLMIAILAPMQAAVTLAAWQQRAARCGGQQRWTRSTEALAVHVLARSEHRFYVTDWGIDPQVTYFSRARGAIRFLGILNEEVTTKGPYYDEAARVFADPASRLVSFVPGNEVIPQYTERLETLLALHGHSRKQETVIYDPIGRPTYLIWRLEPIPARSSKSAMHVVPGPPRWMPQSPFH